MGVEFVQLSSEDLQRINSLISRMSVIPGAAQGPAASHRPITRAVQDIVAAPPTSISRQTPPNNSADIYKACTELKDAVALLESSALSIEPRAINEFMRAIDHARHTTESIQSWLENGAGQDRYKFRTERDAARVRTVTALARELCVDVDASALTPGSEGFEGLFNAISLLHKRLVTLMHTGRADQAEHPISPS
jgi:exonuclease VII small subunit